MSTCSHLGISVFCRALLSFILLGTTVAYADAVSTSSLTFYGEGPLGKFSGQMVYGYNAVGPDLKITLANTSNPSNGGYITGFVFNVATDEYTVILDPNPQDIYVNDNAWTDKFWDVNGPEKASPFDPFEAGAALAKKQTGTDGIFLGPGDPTRGIAQGTSASFTFDVRGLNPATLSVTDFVTQKSDGPDGGSEFLVRFMGFNDGGSNKAMLHGYTLDAPTVVPLPASAWAGLSLLGILGIQRWRRSALARSNGQA